MAPAPAHKCIPTLPEIQITNSHEIRHFQFNDFQVPEGSHSLCFPSPFPLLQPRGARLKQIHPLLAWLGAPGPAGLLELFLPLEHGKQIPVTLFMSPPTLHDAPQSSLEFLPQGFWFGFMDLFCFPLANRKLLLLNAVPAFLASLLSWLFHSSIPSTSPFPPPFLPPPCRAQACISCIIHPSPEPSFRAAFWELRISLNSSPPPALPWFALTHTFPGVLLGTLHPRKSRRKERASTHLSPPLGRAPCNFNVQSLALG